MELLEQLTTVEEMVQALKEESIRSNCNLTGFEVHKDSYLNRTKNDICISWWDYNGHQQPVDVNIGCSSEEEQEAVYSKWWIAIEIAGGKSRKTFEEEQEAIAKRKREWAKEREESIASDENLDWMKALGI